MNERSIVRMYQGAARTWLVLALLAMLLPPAARYGVWLPLHLALAGAVSVAISGAMAMFAQVLTGGPPHPTWMTATQFVFLNFGVGLATLGFVTHEQGTVAIGGTLFFTAMLILGVMVLRSRKRGLNARHRIPLAMYLAAIACVLVGATAGALLGSGAIVNAELYVGIRRAHQTLNVLGWASFAIVGTLITLFPSVLKVRMVSWRGRWPAAALMVGVITLGEGLSHQLTWAALLGLALYAGGALAVTWMLWATVRAPRKHGLPITARHMLAANLWWLIGIAAFIVAVTRDDIEEFRLFFMVAFVGGWVLQTLVGTWLYLLPVWRPGPPEARARWVRIAEFGGWTQVATLNLGLGLLAVGVLFGGVDQLAVKLGGALAVATLVVILGKAFVLPSFGGNGSASVPAEE